MQEKNSGFALKLLEPKTLKQINEDGRRLYVNDDGDKFPSVTTALGVLSKKGIAKWRARVGNEAANKISTQASRAGTAMHDIAEKYVLGTLDGDVNPIALNTFKFIQPYLDDNVDEIYGVELRMYSNELRTAGTADLICRYNGVNTLLDFKTSKRYKKREDITSYFLQCAAYSIMAKEHYDLDIDQFVILMAVHGEGSIEFVEPAEHWKAAVRSFFKLYHAGKLEGL